MIGILAFTDTGRALAGKVEAALTSESSAEPVDLFRGDRGTASPQASDTFRRSALSICYLSSKILWYSRLFYHKKILFTTAVPAPL